MAGRHRGPLMIQLVLIVLVAVLVLAGIIGGLALHYLRGDDEQLPRSGQADPVDDDGTSRTEAGFGVHGLVLSDGGAGAAHGERPGESSASLRADLISRVEVEEDMAEPVDGDAYAAELHAIGQAAAADVLDLHLAWYPGRMPHWLGAAGGSLEDWQRCWGMSLAEYVRDRRKDERRWAKAWVRDREKWRREMGLAA